MELTKRNKEIIDSKSYEELLRKWRFAPVGDSWFKGETGDYWKSRMNELRAAMDNSEHVETSKRIGWGN